MRNVITGVGNLQRRRRRRVYMGTRVLQCRGARIYSLTPQRRHHLSLTEFYAAQKKGFNSTIHVRKG